MKKHWIDIVGKWSVVLAYDIREEDFDEVDGWLESLGVGVRKRRDALSVLHRVNKGFTFSNDRLRMSVMCVGHASSREQWWDTVVHEIDHVQKAIMDYYDIDCGSEDAAWLQGYLMRRVVTCVFG